MKILNPKQLREVESITVKNRNIGMIDLMETAATAVFDWLNSNFDINNSRFLIFCGTGNNGGDGLVVARLLKQKGNNPIVFLLKSDHYSEDNQTNQNRLKEAGVEINFIDEDSDFDFRTDDIIIDSIFGYGLDRPLNYALISIIEKINLSECQIISIDLPSGMYCDRLNSDEDTIVHADVCLTFNSPKLSMLLPENEAYLNRFEILDIGLDKEAVEQQASTQFYTLKDTVSKFKKERKRFGYKYNYGSILLIGGSYGMMGAVNLSARATMRTGAGLLTVYTPKCGLNVIQTSVPEAMVMTDFSDDKILGFPDIKKFSTIAIGPGMGSDNRTLWGFEQFLSEIDLKSKKIVIDADGINIVAKNRNLLKVLPENTIFTPHSRELERLVGGWSDSQEKIKKIEGLCKDFGLIVVSKGAYSQVHTHEGEIHFNSTANPGMSTAGSGDVLTGMIAGLLARGHSPKEAAILGVYLHGLSGDLAAQKLGQESLIASDLIDFIPKAFLSTF